MMAFWGPILASLSGGLLVQNIISWVEHQVHVEYYGAPPLEPTDEQIAYAQAMKELDAIDAIYLGES